MKTEIEEYKEKASLAALAVLLTDEIKEECLRDKDGKVSRAAVDAIAHEAWLIAMSMSAARERFLRIGPVESAPVAQAPVLR